MSDDAIRVQVRPPLRCYHAPYGFHRPDRCGKLALWKRPGGAVGGGYFCERHRQEGDEPLGPDQDFRRVSLHVQVFMSGVSGEPKIAHLEALNTLESAVRAAGGVLNLLEVTSTLARYSAPPAPSRGRGLGAMAK